MQTDDTCDSSVCQMAHHLAPKLHVISVAQVVANLTYTDLIPAVERGLANFSRRNEEGGGEGGMLCPQRTVMNIEKHDGSVFVMPVYSSADNIVTTKIVTRYPKNGEKHNLSSHMSTIIVNDARTGAPIAVMDGDHLTSMRTAAASAVATKYLAKDGWQTLAILGAGAQAEAHLHAFRHIAAINEVRLWARSFEKAKTLAQKFCVNACERAEEAVKGADVIVTCTSSTSPVLESSWLKPRAHINCVGACVPWAQELGPEVMRKAVVYTDNTAGALKESGDILHSKVEVFGEIGEVINGDKVAKKDDITVFKSQGLAIEDAVAAKLVYDKVNGLSESS